jgi:hypothetical protein
MAAPAELGSARGPSSLSPLATVSPPQHYWLWVLCLLGVDYFSSLAYQPSITFEVAGYLGPIATVVVVLITLLGALPVYAYMAGKSPHGLGSIAVLERMVRGWGGKTLILFLLGFAATDFVMTRTLSLADAAEHLVQNQAFPWRPCRDFIVENTQELLQHTLGIHVADYFNEQLVITLFLGIVGFVFWAMIRRGFSQKAIVVSVVLITIYMLLNAVVIGSGLMHLREHPEHLHEWWENVRGGNWHPTADLAGGRDVLTLGLLCLFFFPQLALGLSGLEMSLILMPQVRGDPGDDPLRPRGRIRNVRKVLVLGVLIMTVYLLSSVLVTTTLIPAGAFAGGGQASNRALAYLAHGGVLANGEPATVLCPIFGIQFGSLYDISTVLVLTLAGTSVITVLGRLLPQFLLRFGMELRWVHNWGVLFALFALLNLAVTVWFRADVSSQRGAYATGVLALMLHASAATVIDRWHARTGHWLIRLPWWSLLTALLFLVTTVTVIAISPSGLVIASAFIGLILCTSVISRALRSDELRTVGFEFKDETSHFLWDSLKMLEFPVLVPHRPGERPRDVKEKMIREEHQIDPSMEVVFLEIDLADASDFYQTPQIEVVREGTRFVIAVTRCASVPHAVAAVALELSKVGKPPALHFGWSELSLVQSSWGYLAFGEGNVPWKVRALICQMEPDPQRRPRVIVG